MSRLVPGGVELKAWEYELMLQLGEALHSTLELHAAFARAVPLLQQLVSVDHIALAVSRPGSLYDYEWFNNTLPQEFLGNYAAIADQDFVRDAVAPRPNLVLRDHQMITRHELERNAVYEHARATGANLEQVMAVMLQHGDDWSSGLSLYRSRRVPFSDHEARLLQMVVPQIKSAVCNSRQHAALQREALLEPVVDGAGLAVVWVQPSGSEVARTAHASRILQHWFSEDECRKDAVPAVLFDHLRSFLASCVPNKTPPKWIRHGPLSCLHVAFVPLSVHGLWALVFRTSGIDPELGMKLSPRLAEIAGCILQGMSNEEIAERYGRALATIKQQASEIYARLGVDGRKGLIRLAWDDEL